MHHHYKDIRERIAEAPLWWDEHAVPRYCAFAPKECADIYADEAALVLIACQACGHRFKVAMTWGMMEKIQGKGRTLADNIREDAVHFGDPPNVECCPAGATMNCDDIKVLEYWKREHFEWVRDSSLEIILDETLR